MAARTSQRSLRRHNLSLNGIGAEPIHYDISSRRSSTPLSNLDNQHEKCGRKAWEDVHYGYKSSLLHDTDDSIRLLQDSDDESDGGDVEKSVVLRPGMAGVDNIYDANQPHDPEQWNIMSAGFPGSSLPEFRHLTLIVLVVILC